MKEGGFSSFWKKITTKQPKASESLVTTGSTTYEINLVPEVKVQMIKVQKLRNLVLFICIVVAVASVSVVAILFSIKSGQDIAMHNQDKKLETLSVKLNDYGELGDLTAIQSQLKLLSDISGNKAVLSRVFAALKAMLPTTGDLVQVSELRTDLTSSVITLDAQADARVEPLIDYRVLESFKKGVGLTKYDYGRFVDVEGTEIPSWCISEADQDGNTYRVGDSYYAWWDLALDGCQALPQGTKIEEDDEEESKVNLFYNKDAEVETVEQEILGENLREEGVQFKVNEAGEFEILDDDIETRDREDGVRVYVRKIPARVKIWRTPQFNAWFKAGYMELGGEISGIEHFNSECTTYSGVTLSNSEMAKWTSNNTCMLVPDGLRVTSSSNGRDDSDNLVLKFDAQLTIDPEFFAFRNKHMMAISPSGQNVTDSFIQIGGMFAQEARDCEPGDAECLAESSSNNKEGE